MVQISGLNLFFLCLGVGIVGVAVGATSHWAIALAAKVKAWENKEAKAAEAELLKVKLAAEHDAALVEAAAKGLVAIWDKLKADAAALEAAKAAAAAAQAPPPAAQPPAAAPPAPPPPAAVPVPV